MSGVPHGTAPVFVDNRDGNTLARAIVDHLAALRSAHGSRLRLDVASGFFNVAGFRLLADELEKLDRVHLLLGAEPSPEAERPARQPGDPTGPAATQRDVAVALGRIDDGLRRERDLLPFEAETDAAVRRLVEWVRSGRVEVRRHSRQFLHAKAYLFRVPGGGVVVGSSNLTWGGLRGNLELDLGQYDGPVTDRVGVWFDELWSAAEPFDLAELYDPLMADYPPWLVYLRILFELYGEDLGEDDDGASVGAIPLTSFQQHGVARARRLLRRHGGVLIADGVGLGKTFIAGALIEQYLERRQRVLLVCPASLRDSTWSDFVTKYQLFVERVSYEQLAREQQLGGEQKHLGRDLAEYALVVVDEAHNYRNPDAPARAAVLRRLLQGPRRDVVLLTATPVNNSLWDLYHLLRFFMKQDAALADHGVISIRERFERGARLDPFRLSPDLLYPVIDATTVKRTRQFVKKHYANETIQLPDGRREPIRFPKPVASTIEYSLDRVLPGFLDRLEEALVSDGGASRLKMARYKPENYPAGSAPLAGDPTIVGLLRCALLKRFESSVYAFAKSCRKMAREHDLFLKVLAEGYVLRGELLRELSAAEDEDLLEELLASSERRDAASDLNVAALRADVAADRDILDRLAGEAERVGQPSDPKLDRLVEELTRIATDAEREGVSEEDRRRKRKVLVFSYFSDTVDWIEGHLDRALEKDPRLKAYRGRMASVAGDESRRGVSRDAAVEGFAPESSRSRASDGEDRFDLLIATDVLAEGMNLQQCRNIVNYDLPWNPMRLVQRHGRIDRIGSPHERVFLRTFFPDDELDRLLALEARVRRKLAQAAASVGVEVAPIEHGAEGQQSFADTKQEIEKLRREDATLFEAGGTAADAQTGEEYRQELRKGLLVRGDEIRALPWKAGSGVAYGTRRGHLFCARIDRRVCLRFVPFLRTTGANSELPLESELGTCLRMVECDERTHRVMPLDLKQTAFAAWQIARADVHASWMVETDPANLQPKVAKFNRELAGFVREHPPIGMDQKLVDAALDAIESPSSRRDENELRKVFQQPHPSHALRSLAIVETVRRLGLEPFRPQAPLAPITPGEVHLICWMAIEASS